MRERKIVVPPQHLFPADEWRLVETHWAPGFAARAETALALSNGYLGVRGIHDEGRPAVAPGVFVNGFHETWPIIHAEDAYGLARRPDDRQRAGRTIIELYVDDEPLFVPTAPARVPPRSRHAQRDPDPRAVVGDTVGQARPSAQHTARVVRAPPRGGHVLRGDAGSAGAGDHPLTGAQPVERRREVGARTAP